MNFLRGKVEAVGAGVGMMIDTGHDRTMLRLPMIASRDLVGREIVLGLRPERITDQASAYGAEQPQSISVRVDLVEPTGPDTLIVAVINGNRVLSRVHPGSNPRPGEIVPLLFDISNAVLFDPATGDRLIDR